MPAQLSDIVTIIPVKNEADNIIHVINQAKAVGLSNLVVGLDPHTTDQTESMLQTANLTYVKAHQTGYDFAVHSAWQRSLQVYPSKSLILFADAGGKYDLTQVAEFINRINLGADLVLGSRAQGRSHMKWHQRLGTNFVLWPINFFFGQNIIDISPFRLITSPSLTKLNMQPHGFGYPTQMLVKSLALGLKIAQVPIVNLPRLGQSKVSGSIKNSLLAGLHMSHSLRYVFYRP